MLQKKLDDNIYGHERYYIKEAAKDLPSYQYQARGYKRRKLTDLSVDEKLDVVEDIVVKKDYH